MDNFDIYGMKPKLYFNKKAKVKTFVGMGTSLILAVLTVFSMWFFGKDMIYRETPTLITSSFNVENPAPFPLTKKNFYLALGLTDGRGANFIDETYYSVVPTLEIISFDSEGKIKVVNKPVTTKRCSEVEFPLLEDRFSKLAINNLFCIDEEEMVIQGEFGQEVFTTLQVECRRCTGKPNCKSNEEIIQKMKKGYFSSFLVDYSLDPTNYEQPLQPFLNNIFTIIDPTIYKDLTVYIAAKDIVSDTGIIFEDKSEIKGFAVEKTVELQSSTPMEVMLNFFIRLSKTTHRYQRIYLKVQKVAANMGGIIKILVIMGRILTYPFTDVFYFETASEWIFPAKPNKMSLSEASKSSMSINNFTKFDGVKILKQNAGNKKVSSVGIISYLLCRRNKATKGLFEMRKKYGDYVKSRFDLKSMVKYQNEFILLKKMLLSEDQNKLVTFFESFHNYSRTEEEAYTLNSNLEKASEGVKTEIEHSVRACKNSNSSRDKLLLSILGLN